MFDKKLQESVEISITNPEKAYKIAKAFLDQSIDEKHIEKQFHSLSVMAYSCQFLGMYNESYGYAVDALNYFEKTKNDFGVAFNLNTLGFIYNYYEDHKNRLQVNLKSLELRKKVEDKSGIFKSLNNTGDTYLHLNDYDNALRLFHECLNYEEILDDRFRSVLYANLSETYLNLQNYDSALKYASKSYELAKRIKFHSIVVANYIVFVKTHLARNEYDISKIYLDKLSKTIQKDERLDDEIELNRLQSQYYFKIKDFEKAYVHEQKVNERIRYKSIKKQTDEIKSIQTSFKLKKLESKKSELESLVQLRTNELENTLKELRSQNNLNKRILNSEFQSIIVFDENGIIKKFNSQAKKSLNLRVDKNLSEYISFRNNHEFKNLLKHLFKLKHSKDVKFNFEMASLSKEKELILNVNFTSIIDDSEVFGIAFIEDITYRVEAEKQRKEDLEAEISINYFAQFLFDANSIDEIFWFIAKNCISKLGFVDCVLYIVDDESNKLVQKAAYGDKNPDSYIIKDPIEIEIGSGIVGSVAKTGQYELIDDTSLDDRYIIDDDIRYSELTIPIKINNKVIGVIDSEHPKKAFYTDKHIRILSTIANLAGNKIEKLLEQDQNKKLQHEIISINESLESQVKLKTEENLKLNKEIVDQEKIMMLAEMASLTSHELNTPLANIKNASQELIDRNNKIIGIDSDKIEHLFDKMNFEPILNNIIGRKEIKENHLKIEANLKANEKEISPDGIDIMSKYSMTSELCVNVISDLGNHKKQLTDISEYIDSLKLKEIISKNIQVISNVLLEMKSLENFSKEDNNLQSTFLLDQIIKKALLQTNELKEINSVKSQTKEIEIIGVESKILQLYIEVFRITEENIKIDKNSRIKLEELYAEPKRVVQITIDKIKFLNKVFDKSEFLSQNDLMIDTASKIRLRIINSILSEHNAVFKHIKTKDSLIFTIEF